MVVTYHLLLKSQNKERIIPVSLDKREAFKTLEKDVKNKIPLLSDHLDVSLHDVPRSMMNAEKIVLACGITEKDNVFISYGATWVRLGELANPLLRLRDADTYVECLKTGKCLTRVMHLDVLKEVKKKKRKQGRDDSIEAMNTRLSSVPEEDESSSDGEPPSSDGESPSSDGESSSSPEVGSYASTMALLKREMDKLWDLMEPLKINKNTMAEPVTRAMKENVNRSFAYMEACSENEAEYKTMLALAQLKIDKLTGKSSATTQENIVQSIKSFVSRTEIIHNPGKKGGRYREDDYKTLSSIATAVCMDPDTARQNCIHLGLSDRFVAIGRQYAAKIVAGVRHSFKVRKKSSEGMWEAIDEAIAKYCHDDNFWRVNSNQTAIRIGAKRRKIRSSNPNSNHHTYTGGSSHAIRHHLIGGVIDEQLEDFKKSHYWTDLVKQYPKAHCSSSKELFY